MRPAFILLLAVVFLSPVPAGLSRQAAPESQEALSAQAALSSQSTKLKGPTIPGAQGKTPQANAQITALLGKLPLYFVENKGQVNDKVRYYTKTKNGTVYFTGEEIVYQFLLRDKEGDIQQEKPFTLETRTSTGKASTSKASTIREETIRVSFVGANKRAGLEGRGEQEAKFSYFRGTDPQKSVSSAPSYQKVVYGDLYPGVDLVVSGREGRIKNEYIVRAGGDPAAIRLKYDGAKALEVNKKGQLEIQTSAGMLIEDVPLSYQILNGHRRYVRSKYWIAEDWTILFQVEEFRKDTELIIDPLTYSTYLGGSGEDYVGGIAVDGNGYAFVTGRTTSIDFPATAGAYESSYVGGTSDAFITKINPAGNALVYSTFLGGGGGEGGSGIAIDAEGNVFVAGSTNSSDFPTTGGAYDTTFSGGDSDSFIAKLDSSGGVLLFSTFLGGTDRESAIGIAIDGIGNAYTTGYTSSSDFPTTGGAFDTTFNGSFEENDVFVTKLDSSGGVLLFSTFLGGYDSEWSVGIAVGGSGNIIVAGYTGSPNFPTSAGAYDTSFNGYHDVFVTKFNSSGSALLYSSFWGGSDPYDDDVAGALAMDGSGNVYVTGDTYTDEGPTSPGVYDTRASGIYDADVFVIKLNSSGSTLLYSIEFGGTEKDFGCGLAIDGSGNAYVTGQTYSSDFPTTSGAYDTSYHGSWDVFLTKLNFSGSALLYSTYLGGSNYENARRIAIDSGGNTYVVGYTSSNDFPTTPGAFDAIFNGSYDVFITKLPTRLPDIHQPITAINFGNVNVGIFVDQATTIYNDGDETLTINSITRTSGSPEFDCVAPSLPFAISAWSSRNITVRFTPASGGTKSAVFSVNSNDPDEPDATFDVSGTGVVVTETVSAPNTPSGPASGQANTNYTYSTGGSTSSLGHDVQYLISWGDGTDSGWLPVGTASAQKNWSSANAYAVKAKARCSTDTGIESSWSSSLSVIISGQGYDNSPNSYKVLPECIWALATGGGTWVSEVQITDITGGSVVSVYFDYGGGSRRGPFTLWTSPGANRNAKYANILSSIDAVDSGAFAYYGRVGAVEFSTQDTSHMIQVVARTLNGDYSKTFPGLNLTDSNTADTTRRIMIQNYVNNATSRSTCGFFNPTADSVTVEFRLISANGSLIGSAFSRTLVGHDFQAFSPFNEAGVSYPGSSYDNVVLWITPTSGSGKVMVFGASANNASNDPAAHIGVQFQGTYDNSPGNHQVIPECIWALATGGGTWVSEVQITDVSGGSVVSVYFDYGAGGRRGPFALWTSPGANRNVKYVNILSSIDALDADAFTYYGRVGAVEFSTQDTSHKIQVVARTLNGDYSKTFPGLNLTDSNTADTTRRMIIQNYVNNATYRSTCGFFNPTADSVTVEFRLLSGSGTLIGSAFSKTFVGHDFQAFSPFLEAGVPYPGSSYDNVVLWITPISGSGRVMVFGASANNASNDPAAHIGVQYQ